MTPINLKEDTEISEKSIVEKGEREDLRKHPSIIMDLVEFTLMSKSEASCAK